MPQELDATELRRRLEEAYAGRERVVLEGFHPLKHALRFGASVELAVTADLAKTLRLAASLAPDLTSRLHDLVMPVPPALFDQLAPVRPPTGILAIARRPSDTLDLLAPGTAPVVVLDHPRHLGNVGAAIRTAAAASAEAVILVGAESAAWHPAALRGSAGLHFALPVIELERLPATSRPIVALDPAGAPISPQALAGAPILMFGSERNGISPTLAARAERRIALPMQPGVSSLNLAAAVAAVLYLGRLLAVPEPLDSAARRSADRQAR